MRFSCLTLLSRKTGGGHDRFVAAFSLPASPGTAPGRYPRLCGLLHLTEYVVFKIQNNPFNVRSRRRPTSTVFPKVMNSSHAKRSAKNSISFGIFGKSAGLKGKVHIATLPLRFQFAKVAHLRTDFTRRNLFSIRAQIDQILTLIPTAEETYACDFCVLLYSCRSSSFSVSATSCSTSNFSTCPSAKRYVILTSSIFRLLSFRARRLRRERTKKDPGGAAQKAAASPMIA